VIDLGIGFASQGKSCLVCVVIKDSQYDMLELLRESDEAVILIVLYCLDQLGVSVVSLSSRSGSDLLGDLHRDARFALWWQ
jgi:hypothetical protein